MENYEKFEQLLQQYSFKELSAEDKQLVQRYIGSEEEYESLRVADKNLTSHFRKKIDLAPGPQTWNRIKDARVGPFSPRLPHYWITKPMPVYATMLLLLGVGLLGWMGGSRYSTIDQVSVNEPKRQVDTVFIASKPDTVVRDRVIYVGRGSQQAATLQISNDSGQDHPVAKGINMKEKEELEKLLVSGSR